VAWLSIAAILGRSINIYGDGKQARDLLYIDDLLDAYDLALEHIDMAAGQVYNLGGGPANVLSVWREFGPMLEQIVGGEVPVNWDNWRPGDQRVFVADIRKARQDLGWQPKVSVEDGVLKLVEWIKQNKSLF
jgi:CDP-paratose 2-epimerase